jgi:molecular chaperone DnaK (HSP70)
MPAGLPRIEVKFLIDANGILHVSAREQRSGQEAEIEVKPTYGLTDEQVEGMILESFDMAEEDFRQRQIIEARNEAENILTALIKGKQNPAWQQLRDEERKQIGRAEERLQKTKGGDDYRAIHEAVERLNQATMRLAELMMDTAVSAALKGRSKEDFADESTTTAGHTIAPAEITRE